MTDAETEAAFGGPWSDDDLPMWVSMPSHNLFGQRLDPRTGEPTDKLHDEHVFEWGWWRAGFTYGSAFMVSVPRGKDRA